MRLRLGRSLFLAALLGLASWQPVAAPATEPVSQETRATFDHSHAVWTALLKAHVRGDRFDYAGMKERRAELRGYLETLAAVTPPQLASWSRDQRYAFWINAYNAFTIEKIVAEYPLDSIRDLDRAFGLRSVFDDEFIPMKALHPEGADDELSLNDIEHGILRPRFEDARVHAAVNCASISCPPLRAEAFTAKGLGKQLDETMRAFVVDRTRNRIDAGQKEARISEIFKWFAEDFERDAGSVRAYLARYAPKELGPTLDSARLRYLDYDWGLNDVERDD
jgi:hypothetical protein